MPFRYRDDQVRFQLFCLLQDPIDGLPRPHLLSEGTGEVMRRVGSPMKSASIFGDGTFRDVRSVLATS